MEGKQIRGLARGRVWRLALISLAFGAAFIGTRAQPAVALTPAGPTTPASSGPCTPIPRIADYAFPTVPAITNRFLPGTPGLHLEYSGFVVDHGKRYPHQILTTFTDLTKVIDGVTTEVVYELDVQNGVLQESELLFAAQDTSGDVWHVGEYPEIYVHGKLTGAPDSWLSGVDGAAAGIDMPAQPRVGQILVQGYDPGIKFWDCAAIVSVDAHRCVPVGCLSRLVETNEWGPYAPSDGHQLKFLANGIGTVAAVPSGGTQPETVSLHSYGQLCPSALRAIRSAALAQDARAYTVAPSVYLDSPPASRTLTAPAC